jgi:hypothetical protein
MKYFCHDEKPDYHFEKSSAQELKFHGHTNAGWVIAMRDYAGGMDWWD